MNLYRQSRGIIDSDESDSSSQSSSSCESDSLELENFELYSSESETDDDENIGDSGNTVWRSTCRSTSKTHGGQQGPSDLVVVNDVTSPLDYFELFLDDDLLTLLVEQTNLYASQHISQHHLGPQSRLKKWRPTCKEELKVFFGLTMLTALVEKKGSLDSYWSTDTMISTKFFNNCMSRNRFQLLCKFLHFTDNTQRPQDCEDALYKVRPVYDHFVKKFRDLYRLGEHISIDEGMLKWRGRLKFRVYIKDKPVKYGIKSYILADSTSHYCWNLDMYDGVRKSLSERVHGLLTPICYGLWHSLYMDNFYNSVALSTDLLSKKVHTVGTLRKNRGAPSDIDTRVRMNLGEIISRSNGKVMVLAWKDRRIVTSISTKHDDSASPVSRLKKGGKGARETVLKPEVIIDYNEHMSGVDHLNQMLSYYDCTRKCLRWPRKVFVYLLSISVHNSYILYKCKTNQKVLSYLHFWKKLTRQLCTTEIIQESNNPTPSSSTRPPVYDPPERLVGGFKAHTLILLHRNLQGTQFRRRCRVCSRQGKRKSTAYICQECNIPLCPAPCYRLYHTKSKL